MSKPFIYHTSYSFERDRLKTSMLTQLYQTGVYAIINNNPALQFNFEPKKMCSIEKTLKKDLKNGKITNLQFGREIKIQEVDGFWKEVN